MLIFKNKKVNLIITKDVDRLNRNLLEFCKFLDLVIKHDVSIYFYLTHEYYDSNQDSLIKIKGIFAEAYSKSLSLKVREAHELRQKMERVSFLTTKHGDTK